MLEQLDGDRLEELAESMLADVHTELGTAAGARQRRAAAPTGAAQRLPGPLVGSQPVQLAAAQDSNGNGCVMRIVCATDATELQSNRNTDTVTNTSTTTVAAITASPQTVCISSGDADAGIVYGSYDEQNHCITIVVPEVVESLPQQPQPMTASLQVVVPTAQLSHIVEHDYVSPFPLISPIPSTVSEMEITTAAVDDIIELADDDDDDDDDDMRSNASTLTCVEPLMQANGTVIDAVRSDGGYESFIGGGDDIVDCGRSESSRTTDTLTAASVLGNDDDVGMDQEDLDQLLREFDEVLDRTRHELFPELCF